MKVIPDYQTAEERGGDRVTFATFFYNRASEIDVTVQAMLAARVPGTRIVVVDDGSTDDSAQRLLKYRDEVDVVIQDNKGFTRSVVDLLKTSDTEFVAICGSGDICMPSRILRQMEKMDSDSELAFCGTASRNIDSTTGALIDRQTFSDGYLEVSDFLSAPPFTHGTVMFRMSAYRAVGGYDVRFKFSQDWDLWLRMLGHGKGFFIGESLYDRRVLTDGASFNARKAEQQLLFKHAALALHAAGQRDRDAFLARVLTLGTSAFTGDVLSLIRHDLSTRYIKLLLGGYRSEAQDLGLLLRSRYDGPTPKLARLANVLIFMQRMGLKMERFQGGARRLIELYRKLYAGGRQ